MNVGKDIMGTMSNTLILAFAGGSLTTMMIIYGYQLQTLQFLNLQEVVIDMIQGFFRKYRNNSNSTINSIHND